MNKRILAGLTSLCLIVGLMPTAALAAESEAAESAVEESSALYTAWEPADGAGNTYYETEDVTGGGR